MKTLILSLCGLILVYSLADRLAAWHRLRRLASIRDALRRESRLYAGLYVAAHGGTLRLCCSGRVAVV